MATSPSSSTAPPPQSSLGHLHYGGRQSSRTSRLGSKPQAGVQFKNQKRFELIARLENAGIPEGATAAMLCISVPRLRTIKKSADYLIARIQITHGIIVDNDSRLAQIKEQRKEILTNMLPPALLVLANELQAPAHTIAERKHKAAIAQDLLDREGTFAKVSRTEIKPVDAFDFEGKDAESRSIIAAIRGVAAAPAKANLGAESLIGGEAATGVEASEGMHSLDAIEVNNAFSNSHTLSQTDQEKALEKLEAEAAGIAAMEQLDDKSVIQ